MSSADTATGENETEATEPDARRESLLAKFAALLGDDLLESHIDPGIELWIRIRLSAWKRTHEIARLQLGLRFFEFLSVIDWMPSPYGKSEDAAVDLGDDEVPEPAEMTTGVAGGDTRFQMFSRLIDISQRDLAVVIKADIPETDGALEPVESIMPVFPGANWHEREAHEMFGVPFTGHPYLAPLYLPTEFEGNPLRKDFPLAARLVKPWPGIVDVEPMPDSDDDADDDAEGGDDA